MTQQTAFQEVASRFGAVFEDEAGWLVPLHYGKPEVEYQSARSGAVLFDISHQGTIQVSGPDAASFLHNLCTNDILHLPAGAGREAFFTTGQGKIVGHAIIEHVSPGAAQEAYWLVVSPGMADQLLAHLDHYLVTEQVELSNRTTEMCRLHVAGPQARTMVEAAFRRPLGELASLGQVRLMLGDSEICIRSHEPLALPGYDLVCRRECAGILWTALTQAGARPSGMQVYHTLRIEAGTPWYGIDIDDTNLPQEVGRTDQAVSFTKGCYIGQETIARIRTYGHVNRSLVGLKAEGNSPLPSKSKVLREGKEIGHVTSSAWSPSVGAVIGLAYVRRGNQDPGTSAEIAVAGAARSAVVASLPFCGSELTKSA
jgi:folate-binding protein YgfZ